MKDTNESAQIDVLKNCIISSISPLKVYLFGSFANNTDTPESDIDFYVIVDDMAENTLILTQKAYKAIRGKKNRPVDIVIVRQSKFEERKSWELSLEREINEKGVLLYAA